MALAAFTIVALFASALAELARSRAQEAERRRAEADLAAVLAHELLLGEDTQAALASAARRVAESLGLASAAIEPTPARLAAPDPHRTLPPPPDPRRVGFPLRGVDGTQMATLLVPVHLPPDTEQRLRTRADDEFVLARKAIAFRARVQYKRVTRRVLCRSD